MPEGSNSPKYLKSVGAWPWVNMALHITMHWKCENIPQWLNDALNTFYIQTYGVAHKMVKDQSDSKKCDGLSDQSFMVDPMNCLSSELVLHEWCNKRHGMCYPVCGMVYIKEPSLLIRNSNSCSSGSEFSLTLSGPLPYIQRHITVNKMC